jgi:hypothetical protein
LNGLGAQGRFTSPSWGLIDRLPMHALIKPEVTIGEHDLAEVAAQIIGDTFGDLDVELSRRPRSSKTAAERVFLFGSDVPVLALV